MDQLIEVDCTESSDVAEKCELVHPLNWDCCIKVLGYVSVSDLLQASNVCPCFEEIIKDHVIIKKLLIFDTAYTNSPVVTAFGKSMRKISVTGSECNQIMDKVVECCTPSILTEIEIRVNSLNLANETVCTPPLPSFTALQKLCIESYGTKSIIRLLNQILRQAPNLKILKIQTFNANGIWLSLRQLNKLRELWIHTEVNVRIGCLTTFLRHHPDLVVFSLTSPNDVAAVANSLSKYCKNLNNIYFQTFASNGAPDAPMSYDFFTSFSNLKKVMVTSPTYSPDHPMVQAISKYNVKELKVDIDVFQFRNEYQFKHLIDSQTVEVDIREHSMEGRIEELYQSTFNHAVHIVSQMKNLEKLTLKNRSQITNIHRILDQNPDLKELSIKNVNFLHLPVEVFKLLRSLNEIRRTKKHQHLLHLIVNREQLREFRIYETEDLVSLTCNIR